MIVSVWYWWYDPSIGILSESTRYLYFYADCCNAMEL